MEHISKTTLRLDSDILDQVKAQAADAQISLNAAVNALLARALGSDESLGEAIARMVDERIAERLPSILAETLELAWARKLAEHGEQMHGYQRPRGADGRLIEPPQLYWLKR